MQRGELEDICFWRDPVEFLPLEIILSISNKHLLQFLKLSNYVWSETSVMVSRVGPLASVVKVPLGPSFRLSICPEAFLELAH